MRLPTFEEYTYPAAAKAISTTAAPTARAVELPLPEPGAWPEAVPLKEGAVWFAVEFCATGVVFGTVDVELCVVEFEVFDGVVVVLFV